MKDNFSVHARDYAQYRPDYPRELFEFILGLVKEKKIAWDCATGNGQSAKILAANFDTVYATDISQKQIDHAIDLPNVFYSVQPAEKTDFPDNYFDLVTVAQALHWFEFDKFYREVNRTLVNDGIIATWMYGLLEISPAINEIIHDKLYEGILGQYWDEERKHVDQAYRSIPFPFEEIQAPIFTRQVNWTIGELHGYLETWSAVQKFISKNNYSPVTGIIEEIARHWKGETMSMDFKMHMKVGRIHK